MENFNILIRHRNNLMRALREAARERPITPAHEALAEATIIATDAILIFESERNARRERGDE